MKLNSKVMVAVGSLMLALLYVLPMWKINLAAPQYPEGMGLYIWIDKISGENPNDLRTINGLNHYIGMKEITPQDIPELSLMPYIVAFLIATGLIVAAVGKRFLLFSWVVVFLLVLLAGLVDFYLWEYDYGHNLNPNAAIKIPGMSFQPPLIGTKQLLNMRTTSLPHLGGIAAGISFLLACLAMYFELKSTRQTKEQEDGKK